MIKMPRVCVFMNNCAIYQDLGQSNYIQTESDNNVDLICQNV